MMVDLFNEINELSMNDRELNVTDDEQFLRHIHNALMFEDEIEHLPIPVYSYIKPTMGTQFILHLLISMGNFSTEIDLTLNKNLRESFRYAKLIGPLND